ncbi:MAG TPA: hypothetical protein VFQ39_13845, partial [Longimicrobium sp.]|nr:hypothetical protein [Longimicrobium sp.]
MCETSPPSDDVIRVVKTLRERASTLSTHLNEETRGDRRLGGDPVRRKNLERVSGQLRDLIALLDTDPPPPEGLASLETVLKTLEKPELLSMHGAWEVADALEIETIRLAGPTRLLVLLESYESKRMSFWSPRFPADELKTLIDPLRSGAATQPVIEEARERLIELEKIRINGYRRDRALVEQKALYLRRMS